jgi:spore coat polysaccharide biosynthesis protein SpsF
MRVLGIVQARLGSTRFPAKIFKEVLGKSLLEIQVERMSKSKSFTEIVIATTTNRNDDLLYNYCLSRGWKTFRGSETDLLDRHYKVALEYNADAVVKIPSDCPLIDHNIIDKVVDYYTENYPQYDYVSNLHPPTYPDGNDVEIMSLNTLKTAWENAEKVYQREHTTPYIYENYTIFKIGNVIWETGLDYSNSVRLTIDYPEDFDLIKKIIEELYPQNPDFTLMDIINLLDNRSDIAQLNNLHNGKFWYKDSEKNK